MICDDKNPEDCDTTLEDHAVDSCRYLLSHVQAPDAVRKPTSKDAIRYEQLISGDLVASWIYDWKD